MNVVEIEEAISRLAKQAFAKDLQIAPPFYLSQGVKDIVVLNPYTLAVLHVQEKGAEHYLSPVEIRLACGCNVVV